MQIPCYCYYEAVFVARGPLRGQAIQLDRDTYDSSVCDDLIPQQPLPKNLFEIDDWFDFSGCDIGSGSIFDTEPRLDRNGVKALTIVLSDRPRPCSYAVCTNHRPMADLSMPTMYIKESSGKMVQVSITDTLYGLVDVAEQRFRTRPVYMSVHPHG